MKIAIFGGSFNPFHKGHKSIAKEALKTLGLDKLYFVPAFKSPFKSKEVYADPIHRVNMINLVKPSKTEVSKFEINRKGKSYTIDTVKYFKQKFPDAEIFLLIGSDNLYKLHKWRDIDLIANLVKIVIFKREKSFSKENIKKYNCLLLKNEIYPYASSDVRKGFFKNVDPLVNSYIGSNNLYIKDIMLAMLDPRRHKHSVSVANYASKYAKVAGVDPHKAWVAGCLHDITKCWPKQKHRQFLTDQGIEETKIADHELHSLTGYLWIKNVFKLQDEEILNAVLKHTSLSWELSLMDRVIYAADKMCDGRKHEGIQKDRELILEDFDAGFKKIVQVIFDIIKKERRLNEEQIKIFKRWI